MTSQALAPMAVSLRGENELDLYVSEISKYPILDKEEELALARKHRDQGDIQAAHKLVVSNLRFVVKVAHRYKGYGFKLLDLVQEGNIGLMHAVKKFDPEKGYRLISYAVWWIKAHIQNYIMRSWSMVKLGSGRARRKLFFKLRSAKSELEKEAGPGGQVTDSQLAERLGVEPAEIEEMNARLAFRDYSLDAPVNESGDLSHLDMLDGDLESPEQVVQAQENHTFAHSLVEAVRPDLNEKEQAILDRRLLSEEPETLAQISESFGVSRERIRQLQERTLEKLRAAARSQQPAEVV